MTYLHFAMYRMGIVTADDSALAHQSSEAHSPHNRHLLQSTMSPADACALFGQGYYNLFWDAEKSKARVFPDGECGPEGMGML